MPNAAMLCMSTDRRVTPARSRGTTSVIARPTASGNRVMVTVHSFTLPNKENGTRIMSTSKRTAEEIAAMGGEIVPETAETIDEAQLTAQGDYLRTDSKQNM